MSDQHMEKITNVSPPADVATHLSSNAFSNPQEFLKVLQRDADKINPTGSISRSDLITYSQVGSDAQGRIAAEIAAKHFDDFSAMSNYPNGASPERNESNQITVSKDDLKTDLELSQGQTHRIIAKAELEDAAETALGVGFILSVGGLGAVSSVSDPPFFIPFTIAAVTAGIGLTAPPAHRLMQDSALIKEYATADQHKLGSWPEINGGQTKKF
jgi:hypothetical protein